MSSFASRVSITATTAIIEYPTVVANAMPNAPYSRPNMKTEASITIAPVPVANTLYFGIPATEARMAYRELAALRLLPEFFAEYYKS